jgi:hypothetical protein
MNIFLSILPVRELCIQKFKWATGKFLFEINTMLQYKAEISHTLTDKQLLTMHTSYIAFLHLLAPNDYNQISE